MPPYVIGLKSWRIERCQPTNNAGKMSLKPASSRHLSNRPAENRPGIAYHCTMSTEPPTSAGSTVLPYAGLTPAPYNRGLHLLAILTALATFPLIFMGGLVTSKQAGMAVPDWPNTFGYNMFLFPPSQWIGGVFYEHTHRLAGTLVGMLALAMTLWAFLTEPRRWVRWLSVGVLLAVIAQGVLGGVRVLWNNLDLAIVHACTAQAFFCLTALMVAVTSRWWEANDQGKVMNAESSSSFIVHHSSFSSRLFWLSAIAVGIIYLQLVVGAVMRHYQAGLAIPDFPLAYGGIFPPLSSQSLNEINAWRITQEDLSFQTVTRGQVWLHFLHRIGAILVVGAVAHVAADILRRHRHQPLLRRPALLLIALTTLQFILGILTVLMRKPADIASTHVAVGALTLFVAFTIAVRATRKSSIPNH